MVVVELLVVGSTLMQPYQSARTCIARRRGKEKKRVHSSCVCVCVRSLLGEAGDERCALRLIWIAQYMVKTLFVIFFFKKKCFLQYLVRPFTS